MYAWVKGVHATLALISISGFVVRGFLYASGAPRSQLRWVRVAPHLVDTLLLATGVWLAWTLQMHQHLAPWLGAKLVALLLYIGLGMVAFRFASGRPAGTLAWFAAIAVFGYMLVVAITKSVWPLA